MRAALLLIALARTEFAAAQSSPAELGPPALPARIESEIPLASPGTTIRATRTDSPIRIDGNLDEAIYGRVGPVVNRLIQAEPNAGQPSTERTDFWVFFDQDNVYVSVRCWDSAPARMVVNELRRDHTNISNNEHVGIGFDTFLDRRNSLIFTVTPAGARMDGEVGDERTYNGDWNPVWRTVAGRFEGGWTVEAAIPFKSLRYLPGREQTWGFSLRRGIRHKNEMTYLTPIPAAQAQRGMFMQSLAATLVGIEAPDNSRRLEIRPYASSSLTTDKTARPAVSNDPDADVGVDARIGLTQNLSTDFTYNTDFAQVEADEQQVNLTRFSLFFPEKRDFFLENQGLFAFGGVGGGFGGGGGSDIPTLFYSRRIGLNQGRAVPIRAGGRLTGRVGRFSIGALDIQTDDDPISRARTTNFSVVRIKRDVLRRSSVGIIGGHRSVSERSPGSNDTYGVDGSFSFFDNLSLGAFWAQTRTPGLSGDDTSYRAHVDYAGDRYGVNADYVKVGDAFNPEIGFARRVDLRKAYGQFRFSPRPKRGSRVRKYTYQASTAHVENLGGRLETQEFDASFGIEFQTSDRFNAAFANTYEYLPGPFRIANGVTLPVGGYRYDNGRVSWTFGEQRRAAGQISLEGGEFYNGTRTTVGLSGRIEVTRQFSLQPTFSTNWVDLAQGSFKTTLSGSRVTYTMTPLMFVSALVQYNSSSNTVGANVRLRWEYQPGSELFVVLNETRDTFGTQFAGLTNRAVIFKINRLLRF